jgi:hypothetical protein
MAEMLDRRGHRPCKQVAPEAADLAFAPGSLVRDVEPSLLEAQPFTQKGSVPPNSAQAFAFKPHRMLGHALCEIRGALAPWQIGRK